MKKLLGILGSIGAFVLLIFAMGTGKMVGKAAVDSMYEPDIDALLVSTTNKMNKSLPMMVDSETRLDTTTPGTGADKSFNYHYTLVNHASGSFGYDRLAIFAPQLKRTVCGTPEMKKALALGVAAIYIYRGNDDVEVGRIRVVQADCSLSSLAVRATTLPQEPEAHSLPLPAQSQLRTEPVSSSAVVDYSNPHNERCWRAYQDTISSVPDDAPLGHYGDVNSRAQRKLDSCVRR